MRNCHLGCRSLPVADCRYAACSVHMVCSNAGHSVKSRLSLAPSKFQADSFLCSTTIHTNCITLSRNERHLLSSKVLLAVGEMLNFLCVMPKDMAIYIIIDNVIEHWTPTFHWVGWWLILSLFLQDTHNVVNNIRNSINKLYLHVQFIDDKDNMKAENLQWHVWNEIKTLRSNSIDNFFRQNELMYDLFQCNATCYSCY